MNHKELLSAAAERAAAYLDAVDQRPVFPPAEAIAGLAALGGPLPEQGCDPAETLALLDDAASPATVALGGGRYFGFVNGGVLPVALAANWLAAAWGQNAALWVMSPAAAELERIALDWLAELFGLPAGCAGAVVTGATMANFCGLAAARHALLARQGWEVERQGLFGAPPIELVAGDEGHASLLKVLGLLGLGRGRVLRVPCDGQGRIVPASIPRLGPRTILCLQAGNVNTGSFDPFEECCGAARATGAWVHVDGAFGLWAAASPARAALTRGLALADSWATDAHKTLNSGYDCGIAFVRDGAALRAAMDVPAAYLLESGHRQPMHFTPESSRRARGVELWAALKSLGREGVAEMVERMCAHAARLAEGLRRAGHAVLNDVVLNQALVSFGDAGRTRRVIQAVQNEGTCWCGGTVWQGRSAMRISVSSWATTDEDIERTLAAILRAAAETE
jgi:glutamate/tyrosine decarboxylase-like PLP-dependent enzyme